MKSNFRKYVETQLGFPKHLVWFSDKRCKGTRRIKISRIELSFIDKTLISSIPGVLKVDCTDPLLKKYPHYYWGTTIWIKGRMRDLM